MLLLLLLNAACHQSVSPPPLARNSTEKDSQAKTAKASSGIGFATRQKFLDHYGKHGGEFGSVSKDEYLRQAQELRDRPAGGDVLEVTRADGVVTRFDKHSGAFLAFNSDLTIRTFFKPNDGENYFRRQSKRPAGRSGREE
ncbi:MAG: hypothetical protein ABI977_33410 [Acidobacteriota bacterium]